MPRKYSKKRNYSANYTFSTTGIDGEPTGSATITTTFSGLDIIKFGMKKCIRYNAERLSIPKGYKCLVDD